MITAFFLNIFYSLIIFLLGLLPVGSLPSDITTSLAYIVGVMNTFNYFFPIGALFSVLALSISFELAIMVFHFANWIYHKIRG